MHIFKKNKLRLYIMYEYKYISSYYHTPPVKMIDWWQVGGASGIGAGLPVQAGLPV